MYQNQIESKKMRDWKRILTKGFNDDLYKEFYRKHLKPMYKGKITKRFARLTKKLNEAELFDQRNVLNLLYERTRIIRFHLRLIWGNIMS